jgi:hypothetical protein
LVSKLLNTKGETIKHQKIENNHRHLTLVYPVHALLAVGYCFDFFASIALAHPPAVPDYWLYP